MSGPPIPQQTSPEGSGSRSPFRFDFECLSEISLTRWYPLLLTVITLVVYFQCINHEFTYDDRFTVLDDPIVWQGNLEALWNLEGNVFWHRQVRTLTYMIDYAVFGFSPAGYHLHNLFWHTLCVVLVFMLIKQLTRQATVAFFGALIFALHPIHVEAVSNITNRKELLALGFSLIAFLCYLRFLEGKTVGKWGWLIGGVIVWGLGLFSKQITIVLPILVVAYEFLLVPRDQRFLTKHLPVLLGIMVIGSLPLVLYGIYSLDILNFKTSQALSITLKGYQGELTYSALVATSARAFWTYIQLLLWPAGLCPDHVVDLSSSFFDFKVLLSWAGLIAFILTTVRVAPRWPVLGFGMLWFFIGFLPISNWVPTSYVLADRYMYMPSVGFSIILASLGQRFYEWVVTVRPQLALGIAASLAGMLTIAYAGTTLASIPHWRTQETIFTYMLQCHPKSSRAYNGLGIFYLQQGLYDKARGYFTQAISLGLSDAYNNRGNALYHMREYHAALEDYNQIIFLKPDWEKAYNNRGTVLYELKDYEAALKDYNRAIFLKPDWGEPYSNRGILYLAQEQYDRAVNDFTSALERLPRKSHVFNFRGLAHEKLGNWRRAQEDYLQAVSFNPANAEAYFNLGRVQLHQDDLDAAILSYQKAKELGWEQAEEVLNVLRKKGYLQ